MNKGHWNQSEPSSGAAAQAGPNEIESIVRTLARKLGTYTGSSLVLVVDADGTFVYEPVAPAVLDDRDRSIFVLDGLLGRRKDVRAKTFGTEQG